MFPPHCHPCRGGRAQNSGLVSISGRGGSLRSPSRAVAVAPAAARSPLCSGMGSVLLGRRTPTALRPPHTAFLRASRSIATLSPPRATSNASPEPPFQLPDDPSMGILRVLLRRGPAEALKMLPKTVINAGIVALFLGSILSRAATVDSDMWRGWTVWEVISNLPQDNWMFYQESLRVQPLLTPMMITGATYLIADWIAQTYEGNALLEFDTQRLLRSTLTGLVVLGPLAHFYYTTQDAIFAEIWPSSPLHSELLKMFIDNTFYCFVYNFLYYVSLGTLKGHSFSATFDDWKDAWLRLQLAGFRVWPFVGVITHTVIPTEHKVLFVDMVEVAWVTYLSLSANSKRMGNQAAVEDVMSPEKGNLIGEDAAAAKDALTTYVSEVREAAWSSELKPEDPALQVLPADSMPEDHMILANTVEAAMSAKLQALEDSVLSSSVNFTGRPSAVRATLSSLDDPNSVPCAIDNLVAEELAALMKDADSTTKEDADSGNAQVPSSSSLAVE